MTSCKAAARLGFDTLLAYTHTHERHDAQLISDRSVDCPSTVRRVSVRLPTHSCARLRPLNHKTCSFNFGVWCYWKTELAIFRITCHEWGLQKSDRSVAGSIPAEALSWVRYLSGPTLFFCLKMGRGCVTWLETNLRKKLVSFAYSHEYMHETGLTFSSRSIEKLISV